MTREERFNTRSASGRYDDIDRSDDRRRDSRDGRDDRYRSERRSPPRRFDDRQRNDDYRFGDRDRNFNRRNSGGGGFEQRGNSSGWRDLDRGARSFFFYYNGIIKSLFNLIERNDALIGENHLLFARRPRPRFVGVL